jgi:hypothetical protein
LCDGRQGEFELGATRAPETQSDETQDSLQVSEQLGLFAIATRLRVVIGFGAGSGDIASLFVDAARNFTRGLLRPASHFKRAHIAVALDGPVEKLAVIHDLASGR